LLQDRPDFRLLYLILENLLYLRPWGFSQWRMATPVSLELIIMLRVKAGAFITPHNWKPPLGLKRSGSVTGGERMKRMSK